MNKALKFTYSQNKDIKGVFHIYRDIQGKVKSLCKKNIDHRVVFKKPIYDDLCLDCYGTQINLEEIYEENIIKYNTEINKATKIEDVFISSRHDNIIHQLTDPLVELQDKQYIELAEEKHRHNITISSSEVINKQKKIDKEQSLKTNKRRELIEKNKIKTLNKNKAREAAKLHIKQNIKPNLFRKNYKDIKMIARHDYIRVCFTDNNVRKNKSFYFTAHGSKQNARNAALKEFNICS